MSEWILKTHNLNYSYSPTLHVLKDVNFTVSPAELIAIVGVSGVGKSTFLHLLGLLDTPSSGEIWVQSGHNTCQTERLRDMERAALRCHLIGTVYQFHHLLSEFTTLENVMIPQLIGGVSRSLARKRSKELLDLVHLSDRMDHLPTQLSGGQQQRVAIARALANDPILLLADEPTGNLDEETAQEVFSLLCRLSRDKNLAVVMTTHNKVLASHMDRILLLDHGQLVPEKG